MCACSRNNSRTIRRGRAENRSNMGGAMDTNSRGVGSWLQVGGGDNYHTLSCPRSASHKCFITFADTTSACAVQCAAPAASMGASKDA